MKQLLFILLFFISGSLFSQDNHEEEIYTLHKNQWIWYSDLGYRTSPFTLKYAFSEDVKKLKYRHNIKPILGFGVHYKWFALRLGIGLPLTIYSFKKYGQHTPFNIGTQFSVKKMFFDLDFRFNSGYVLKNALRWDSTLNELAPNDQLPNLRTSSFSINIWHFKNKQIHMKPILGRVGHYNRDAASMYFKYTFNVFGASKANDSMNLELVPATLIHDNVAVTAARGIAVIDIGFVPGYAYVKRLNKWQFSFIGGLGGVLQTKIYTTADVPEGRSFLGIAPRLDLKFIGGYNDERYFCHLDTDFDIKSARLQNLSYRQYFYSLKIVGGIRLKEKDRKSKRKESKL